MISREKKKQLDSECRTYVVGRGKRTGHEHLTGYRATDGKRLGAITSGRPDAVAFPSGMQKYARDKRGRLVVHHNHPRGTSLSREDLFNLYRFPGTLEVHAHGHAKQWYRAASRRERLFERLILEADLSFGSCLIEEVPIGQVPACLENHLFNCGLAAAGVMWYDFSLDRETQYLYNQIPKNTTEVLELAVIQAVSAERSRR